MKKAFTDQLGNNIQLNDTPKRIISIVPSQTELLYDLGLDEEVIGITKFCVHPEKWFRKKPRVGGTKKLNFEKINELQPDLIIANKEENEREQIIKLQQHYPVWISDIRNLADALQMIEVVGELIGKEEKTKNIIMKIQKEFSKLETRLDNYREKSKPLLTAYLIWENPLMAAGKDTFINDMLKRCGLKNSFASHANRYPEISEIDLQKSNPDLILLSSEPYPFKEKHIAEIQATCPNAKVLLVDGEMFSWYGSRLLKSSEYFKNLLLSF